MKNVRKIVIPYGLFSQLIIHAEATKPYESVAVIAGRIEDDIAYSEKIYTPENIEQSRVSFTIDAYVLLEIYTEVEKLDKQIIAIYHTHPAPPKPSSTDLEYMEVNPYIWLISSISSPDRPKGYLLLENSKLKEVDIEIRKNQ
ncbi:MAG: M67 family metallopeptidase [Asgard group archaeon]|nr:M67 family metallopeptidase [Asgard group archaeon]